MGSGLLGLGLGVQDVGPCGFQGGFAGGLWALCRLLGGGKVKGCGVGDLGFDRGVVPVLRTVFIAFDRAFAKQGAG